MSRESSLEIVGDGPTGSQVVLVDKDGIAITGEDKLKVDSKIVDYRRTVTILVDSNSVAGAIHIVDDRYNVESIREAHKTASDSGGALNIGIAKGTVTPANSTAQHSTAINMNGTADTVQNVTITTTTDMDAGDRICIKNVANLTNLAGGCVTLVLKRIP